MARKVSKAKSAPNKVASERAVVAKDARSKIISKQRSKMTDARDRLVSLTKSSGDARKRLEKIRNLKMGKLDVKTTAKGRITITTTTRGKTLLTTKKKQQQPPPPKKKVRKSPEPGGRSRPRVVDKNGKNVTRTVGRGGVLSLRTKGKPSTLTGVARSKPALGPAAAPPPSSSSTSGKPLTRTIKGRMSDAAKLDMELMNTKVDPVILKRTVNNAAGRMRRRRRSSPASYMSPPPSPPPPQQQHREYRVRSRSRSPINGYHGGGGRSRYHYDDPRRELERPDGGGSGGGYGRHQLSTAPTMADRFDATGGAYASPLEGAKVVVSNLSDTVSRDDIVELFGDVGALKRAKVSTPGMAEVVFVNRSDAQKAVEIYHNRQLDGKAMRCQIVGAAGRLEASNGSSSSFKLLARGDRKDYRGSDSRAFTGMPVEINSIHKALFSDRRTRSGRDERGGGGAPRRSRY